MATRAELIAKLAQRRFNNHYLPNLTRQQIRQAAQQLTDAQWDAIIQGIQNNQLSDVGGILQDRVYDYLRDLAVADVTTWLQGDTITVDQLLELI